MKLLRALKIGLWVVAQEERLKREPIPKKLGQQQERFAIMYGLLLIRIYMSGYQVRIGDVWANPEDGRHIKNSFHYKRLAADNNLFKDGKYLRKTNDHLIFGKYWESIKGTWGGRFKDGNHYSLGESEG